MSQGRSVAYVNVGTCLTAAHVENVMTLGDRDVVETIQAGHATRQFVLQLLDSFQKPRPDYLVICNLT